jgi:TnpA family transposase
MTLEVDTVVTERPERFPLLAPLIGDTVETAAILGQWTELMRLKASIETGAVVPSVILRKLAAAGAGNVLSRSLRALGRIERTLFTLQWLSDPALRQRSSEVFVAPPVQRGIEGHPRLGKIALLESIEKSSRCIRILTK